MLRSLGSSPSPPCCCCGTTSETLCPLWAPPEALPLLEEDREAEERPLLEEVQELLPPRGLCPQHQPQKEVMGGQEEALRDPRKKSQVTGYRSQALPLITLG